MSYGNGSAARHHREQHVPNRVTLKRVDDMHEFGTVKWFDESRRYGFITPDRGHQDVFLHQSVAKLYGLRPESLIKGVRVMYCVEECAGKRPEATAIAFA